jgi:DNA polymerase-3 subunit epsilon
MFRRWRLQRRCRKLAQASRQDSLTSYIEACGGLDIDTLDNTPVISVDLELTGLDARQNQIIAIGWTQVNHGRISLGANRHITINAQQTVGKSAAIHELTDTEVAGGVPLSTGLQNLFEAAAGRVWLFHHASLDVAFLRQACRDWAGVMPPFAVLDTLHMELAIRKRRDQPIKQGELKLSALRSRYNLPRYTAHNALIDACATAELMLAIAAKMSPGCPLEIKPHMRFF